MILQMKKNKISLLFLLLGGLLPLFLTSCGDPKTYSSLDEINGNSIACVDSSPSFYGYITAACPNSAVHFYKTFADCEYAVENGIDAAFVCDDVTYRFMRFNNKNRIVRIKDAIAESDYGFIFRKNDLSTSTLKSDLDEYILNNSEKLKFFADKWFPTDYDQGDPKRENIEVYSDPKGSFTASIIDINPPFGYSANGTVQGYDADVLIDFAKTYHYNVTLNNRSGNSILAELDAKKCDIAGGGFNITDERKASYNFSTPNFHGDVDMVVFDPSVPATNNPFIDGFYKTFIEDSRWESFVFGTLTTLFITLIAIIGGTFIGYCFYLLGLNNVVLRKIINGLTIFFARTPIVVILMIFYYIFFSGTGVNATIVSVITFTIAFSLTMNGLISHGVASIPKDQFESMYALGYTRTKGFNKVILPQAIRNFAPSYSDEVVSLIKGTSIVGFISVVDLTKATDLIRAASFQTFFPLITSAIIYFLLATILIVLVRFLDKNINPYYRHEVKIKREI